MESVAVIRTATPASADEAAPSGIAFFIPQARLNCSDAPKAQTDAARTVDVAAAPDACAAQPRPVARAALRRSPVNSNYGFNRGRPVDRYYIEKFLLQQSEAIRGRVLEIEHDIYAKRFGGTRVDACDTLHVDPDFRNATIIADLADAPHIAANSFDCLIIAQTLQFIYDLPAAARTMHRILKPGGAALVTVPVVSRLHAPESDGEFREYWRFTSMSAKRLFGEVFGSGNVRVEAYGNLSTCLAGLSGMATEDMRPDELDRRDALYEFLVGIRAEKAA